ncbi:hypothetical protein PRK78_007350 [Emydomyces testavorans]|uniref:Uncharacterized protein n=1 Tax=Emydomyces testavorans TaxID=2070801 RepID=A0AAF0DP62_9EURO|nr:hypothetical protein PRK78_007350 [Emydomyces testavorans]
MVNDFGKLGLAQLSHAIAIDGNVLPCSGRKLHGRCRSFESIVENRDGLRTVVSERTQTMALFPVNMGSPTPEDMGEIKGQFSTNSGGLCPSLRSSVV